jgi:hypothetical protein
MVSKLVLLANLFGLFLIDALFLADVRITQNLPPSMVAGTEVRVIVTVDKGELTGFAKLQFDLPPGMSATSIETKGASFTFAEGKAKFIWMALPAAPTFKVSYTLSADASASGTKQIQGRLSYIEDNERKTYELPAATIEMSGAVPAEVAQAPAPAKEQIIPASTEEDLVSAGSGAPAGTVPVVIVDNASGTPPIQGQGGVIASRTITPVSDKEMIVEVIVKKGNIRGFGKLQETIPEGFSALEKNSDEAIFTAQDRVVKFVWLNLPAREEIKVVYKLRATSQPDGEYTVDGEFGYLLNDETQKAVVGTSRFFIGPKALEIMAADQQNVNTMELTDPQLAARKRAEEEAAKAEAARPPVTKEPTKTTTQTAEKPTKTQRTEPVTARVQGAEKGITFKVQITAAHREVGKAYFVSRHRFNGEFQLERHQGWVKYVTGRYSTYKEARDQRIDYVSAGHNFPGPFVTAYNNGERITVQEALMISQQQWIQ